jgi:hypothetical protein
VAKKLTPEEYQAYKKAWDSINLDTRTDSAALAKDSGSSREEYIRKMQEEARFVEARRRALRSASGLPRKVDYMTEYLKSQGVK